MWNQGTIDLSGCTISGNTASIGGGGLDMIPFQGTATVVACTIKQQHDDRQRWGHLRRRHHRSEHRHAQQHDRRRQQVGPERWQCQPERHHRPARNVVSGSNDLVGIGGSAGLSSSTNKLGVADPDLGPLADNGGPTETMALLTGSPAIRGGNLPLEVGPGGSALTTDQRGFPLDTPIPDIGAYQTQPPGSVSFTHLTSPSITYGTASVTISGILSDGNQAPPDTESVQITLDGVTQQAAIGTGGAFSATFDTSALAASATPYLRSRTQLRRRRELHRRQHDQHGDREPGHADGERHRLRRQL